MTLGMFQLFFARYAYYFLWGLGKEVAIYSKYIWKAPQFDLYQCMVKIYMSINVGILTNNIIGNNLY